MHCNPKGCNTGRVGATQRVAEKFPEFSPDFPTSILVQIPLKTPIKLCFIGWRIVETNPKGFVCRSFVGQMHCNLSGCNRSNALQPKGLQYWPSRSNPKGCWEIPRIFPRFSNIDSSTICTRIGPLQPNKTLFYWQQLLAEEPKPFGFVGHMTYMCSGNPKGCPAIGPLQLGHCNLKGCNRWNALQPFGLLRISPDFPQIFRCRF